MMTIQTSLHAREDCKIVFLQVTEDVRSGTACQPRWPPPTLSAHVLVVDTCAQYLKRLRADAKHSRY